MSLESHSNGDLCLLLNRLIEGEASEQDFAKIELLFRTEPAVLDSYFDVLETHAVLHCGLGMPAAQPEHHISCQIRKRAGVVAESAVAPALPSEPAGRGSAILVSPQTESAPTAVPTLGAYDALLPPFLQNRIKLLVPDRTVT